MKGVLLAASAALALSACSGDAGSTSAQIGPNPQLPQPNQYLFPPMKVASAVGWHAGEAPTVAPGLKIEAVATGLKHPRSLYVLPNGDVLVTETDGPPEPIHRPKDIIMNLVQAHGHSPVKAIHDVVLLRDTNGDGVADIRSQFIDHLVSPYGMALVGHDFYVANTDALVHYVYRGGETRIAGPASKVTDLPGGPIDHHWTKSLTVSRDGRKFYVGVGSNSNITENGIEAEKERAAVWEVDRATGAHRLFATGIRNPTSLDWNPATGQLWAVANERDEIGPNLVPDYLTSVKDGAFYGWPYSYYGQHIDPRVMPQRADLVKRAIPPDYALGSHVAPLGLAFYTAGSLPYAAGGAFVGEHGSWDRNPYSGYKVVYVPFSGGRPSGKSQDVVTGFIGPDGKARGRPVGVAIDKTGALLIADDLGNAVWRVSRAGA
jgi:glucose/arabinose dehydrogenase